MAATNVFVSYAADTKPLAEQLTSALQTEGFDTWADFKDLEPGQRWADEIDHALERARWVLFLVSPQSHATRWLEAEWRAVLTKVWADSDKMLLPIVIGGDEPPPFLRRWVALRIDPVSDPEGWTKRVLQELRSRRDWSLHGLTGRDRQERERRLNEIGRMAQELRQHELGDSSTSPNGKP